MNTTRSSRLLIGLIYGAIFFSTEALIYYIRWFIPFLSGQHSYIVPPEKMPFIWFVGKIISNVIFLSVGILLLKIFRKYRKSGFFGKDSLRIFDWVIISCFCLALLGIIQTICDNFYEMHLEQWTSLWSISNLLFRSFTRLLVFKEPQTMYLLLATILWAVRQFIGKAVMLKKENELFI
ncbi:hypothetical protein [Chitinophaga sp. 212800010-3]|uniref:hypothetical protein n=1 Tax=unclassified Chitinophaga TaxID=2619133 RepID=UPI002DE7BF4C|nr:DUF2975 domain-containing protein [Chitinophaga sp. 212800010-3]